VVRRPGAVEDMGLNPAQWRGRRALVTGHTGFKGSWLCLMLERLGAEVAGYALPPPTDPSLFEDGRVAATLRASTLADVRDAARVAECLRAFRPEVVFHLAAQPLVRASYADPLGTYSTNVTGTANVLEACRGLEGLRAVVVVTTDKCYLNREWAWGYREDDPLGGHDPYSSSKAAAELVTAAYRQSFFGAADYARHGCAVASARSGNVIGGGDWSADRLVPDAIRAFAAGRALRIRYPDATRPWQHVLDPLTGYLMLAQSLMAGGMAFAEPWNFGPGEDDARPVREIVGRLQEAWPGAARWEPDPGRHPHEAGQLRLDCSKARARLGWRPRLPLDLAIRWTADWYRQWAGRGDLAGLTRRQIDDYLQLLPNPGTP
jgi:CDP-glucose 4,6-dehydratase